MPFTLYFINLLLFISSCFCSYAFHVWSCALKTNSKRWGQILSPFRPPTSPKNTQQTFKLKYSEKMKTLLCVQTNLNSTAELPMFITLRQLIIKYLIHKKHSGTGHPGSNHGLGYLSGASLCKVWRSMSNIFFLGI